MIDVPIQVKDALRDGRLRKNYRFNVLNSDGTTDFTINNDTLVSESVSIDERMCSGDTIKFGLCEGSSLEFQYFNHENITDRQIQAFIDIDYGEDVPYSIPMGFFTVKNCSRQASTGIIKATCYNKLQSDYLDTKANDLLLEAFGGRADTSLSIYDIQKNLLSEYAITEKPKNPTAISISTRTSYNGAYPTTFGYFSLLYPNVNTPLGRYEWWKGAGGNIPHTGDPFSIGHQNAIISIDVPQNEYWEIDFVKGDIDYFVNGVLDFLTRVFTDAKIQKEQHSTPVYTEEEIRTKIRNYFDFTIRINSTSGSPSYNFISSTKKPSEILKEINKKIHYDAATITITILTKIGFGSAHNSGGVVVTDWTHPVVDLTDTFSYQYLEGTAIRSDTMTPNIQFSDGSLFDGDLSKMFTVYSVELSDAEKITQTIGDLPEFTLRDIMTADYETQCQFGQLDRVTDLFSGVELNHSRLLPQETLYPDTALYPDGAAASATKSMYSKLWADEGNIHKWRYLIITYKGLDANNSEADFTLQRTINADGTDDYNCSDNWLFRNLVWTAEDVGAYADAMVAKMQDITWFPFEMWCAGLPYLETGDEIEIPLGEDSYTSYVLQRQLKGIQNLQDTYINGTLDIF